MSRSSGTFLGISAGRRSLRALLLDSSGAKLGQCQVRHQVLADFTEDFSSLLETAKASFDPSHWSQLVAVCLGLEKSHRSHFNSEQAETLLPQGVPLLALPGHAATLVGAIPSGPGLLVSLGADLKLAVIDSTQTYREFRLAEGGGLWWLMELERLAAHSPGLRRELDRLGPGELRSKLPHLPRLLELGDFPSPDPVLKPRLDKISATLAESCLGVTTRLPGVKRLTMSGFLNPGSITERMVRHINKEAPHLRILHPKLPREAGAALMGLAYWHENVERRHLERPAFEGHVASGKDWAPSPVLLRRLYKTRRPFEHYPEDTA